MLEFISHEYSIYQLQLDLSMNPPIEDEISLIVVNDLMTINFLQRLHTLDLSLLGVDQVGYLLNKQA